MPPLPDLQENRISLERMVNAVERVRERLLRATAALERARIGYAVVGGNAVAAWVTTVDAAAVRNTQDVDILLRRVDLDAARAALEAAGFVYRHVANLDIFTDGPSGSECDALHIVFAGEMVREGEALPNPDVADSVQAGPFRVLTLEALVRIKLTAFRLKDRVHLLDLMEVGLVDPDWETRLPETLARRLRQLRENPDA